MLSNEQIKKINDSAGKKFSEFLETLADGKMIEANEFLLENFKKVPQEILNDKDIPDAFDLKCAGFLFKVQLLILCKESRELKNDEWIMSETIKIEKSLQKICTPEIEISKKQLYSLILFWMIANLGILNKLNEANLIYAKNELGEKHVIWSNFLTMVVSSILGGMLGMEILYVKLKFFRPPLPNYQILPRELLASLNLLTKREDFLPITEDNGNREEDLEMNEIVIQESTSAQVQHRL